MDARLRHLLPLLLGTALSCTSSPLDDPSAAPAQESTPQQSPEVMASPPPPPLPPPNPWEQRILDALASLGVEGGIAEHGYRSADISLDWRGAELLVEGQPVRRVGLRFRPRSETVIAGVDVSIGRVQTWGRSYRFTCRKTLYEASSLRGSVEMAPSLLARLIPALSCPAS